MNGVKLAALRVAQRTCSSANRIYTCLRAPYGRGKTFVRGVVPRCEECGTVSHVIVLEATEDDVECDEEEDSHDEEFPTVPAHIFSFLSGREAVSTSAESLRQQFEG